MLYLNFILNECSENVLFDKRGYEVTDCFQYIYLISQQFYMLNSFSIKTKHRMKIAVLISWIRYFKIRAFLSSSINISSIEYYSLYF
jgi:hypothetical protein